MRSVVDARKADDLHLKKFVNFGRLTTGANTQPLRMWSSYSQNHSHDGDTRIFESLWSRFKMLNVVKFRRPGAPMRRTESMQTMAIAKRDAPLAPFAIACDSGRGENQRLKAARANAKLTIAHAIATLEENHRQIRALIHKMADSSAGARLEADLDLIERELALAKRKSASL